MDALNKAMLLLLNSRNNNAKKDLCLAYSQGNKAAYPLNLESMARYLSAMSSIKSANNPRDNKKEDKNGKKDNEPKSEDKDNNTIGTAGAHVGETTTPKDSNAPSDGSSIGAHVSEVDEPGTRLTRSVQEILATHAIDDPIWDYTDAYDVVFDTKNSAEALAGNHITGGSNTPSVDPTHTILLTMMMCHGMMGQIFWSFITNGTNCQTPMELRLSLMILQRNPSSRIFESSNVNHKYRTFGAD